MQVVRKPHQIILIEHVFYPILVIIFIALGMTYGGKLALRLTDYQPETIGYAIATITVLLFFILSTILLPYSCARLWVSTNKNLAGFWYFFTKIYARRFVYHISFLWHFYFNRAPGDYR